MVVCVCGGGSSILTLVLGPANVRNKTREKFLGSSKENQDVLQNEGRGEVRQIINNGCQLELTLCQQEQFYQILLFFDSRIGINGGREENIRQ